MTPQEKAESLIDKIMSSTEHAKPSDYSRIYSPTAKKIALMMVDEILDDYEEFPYKAQSGKEYWQDVKQEIENL